MNDASAVQEAAGEAREQAQDLAGQAQEKAREGADKAQETIKEQLGQRSTQAGEKVSGTAADLRSVGEELRGKGKDGPAKLADTAAEQTEKVGSYLTESDPEKILHDIEDFGRQRPWAMLAGGLVVGAVAARFLKASSRDRYQQRSQQQRSLTQVTQPTGVPVGRPVGTP